MMELCYRSSDPHQQAARKGTHSLLNQGMCTLGSAFSYLVHMGGTTSAHVNQTDSIPAVVSTAVHNIGEPIMNLVRDTDRAAVAVAQSNQHVNTLFHLMGFGALGWMGWNAFAYAAPRKHYMVREEIGRVAKRIRNNW
jgi:hypothetical protein